MYVSLDGKTDMNVFDRKFALLIPNRETILFQNLKNKNKKVVTETFKSMYVQKTTKANVQKTKRREAVISKVCH